VLSVVVKPTVAACSNKRCQAELHSEATLVFMSEDF
jgi:hypothetical protein